MIRHCHHSAWAFLWRLWLCCWVALVADLHAATPLPASPTPHYILDTAKWLSPGAFEALDSRLETFERETSSQLVVAILPKIPDGEEMVDYSQRLFELWKPGQAGKSNGAIFLVFEAERKMRIHTGYGLEGVLPDARCKQIIEDVVAPLMRQGQREAAITAGVDAMIAAAKGEYTGTGKTRLDGSRHGSGISSGLIIFIILVIWIAVLVRRGLTATEIIFTVLGPSRSSGGWGGSSGGWGGSSGGWGGSSGGGFSGGGGSSGGGGASGGW
jgi:uncharacterized protein